MIKRYCSGCHNSKVNTSGIALDTLDVQHVARHPRLGREWSGKLSTRSCLPPACHGRTSTPTKQLWLRWNHRSMRRCRQAQSRPNRYLPPAQPHRISECHPRPAGLDVDVASLLPSDESSHGFDNVTVGDLSPTLLERYLSAARKISRLAIGSPSRSPGGDTVTLPPDLTQEEHFDELPLGTRGGMVVHYTFPLDAEYEIQLRLQRDRNEHVEGLTEPHEVELMLDGERVQLFTVKPPPAGNDHHAGGQGPECPRPGEGRSARGRRRLSEEALGAARNRAPALPGALQYGPASADSAGGLFDLGQRSVRCAGPGDTPSRRRIFVCQPAKPAEEEGCAKRILSTLMRRAYRRPVTDADLQVPLKFYQGGADGRWLRSGHRDGACAPCW